MKGKFARMNFIRSDVMPPLAKADMVPRFVYIKWQMASTFSANISHVCGSLGDLPDISLKGKQLLIGLIQFFLIHSLSEFSSSSSQDRDLL